MYIATFVPPLVARFYLDQGPVTVKDFDAFHDRPATEQWTLHVQSQRPGSKRV